MAKVTYTVLDRDFNSIPENENYSSADLNLVENFKINKNFNFEKNYIETHFYSINNDKLYSIYDYNLSSNVVNSTAEDSSVSTLSIDPAEVAIGEGFDQVDIKLAFHFLNDLFTIDKAKETFYIQEISTDRQEILVHTNKLSVNQIINKVEDIKQQLEDRNYFEEIWINFGNNDLFIVTNIDVYELDGKYSVALKLYEPLPSAYNKKSTLNIVEKVSDSIATQLNVEIEEEDTQFFTRLRQANFDVDTEDVTSKPTEYFDYNTLFSFTNSNNNRELYSYIKEKSVDINIDYSDYDNFINFSTAEERLKNFKYKVQLLETYQNSLDSVNSLTSASTNSSGSISHYEKLIKGIVDNFDHYERHLYFESGSTSWPKTTTVKPHINLHSTSSDAVSWYAQQLTSASNYDISNYDALTNTVPGFLSEDPNNDRGMLFVSMLGQHFDNLWVYTKAVTDKYDTDNRLNVGASKDLIQELLVNFGVKLYNSIEGSNDLFKYLIGDTYDSGSFNEVVNNYVTVDDIPTDSQPISRKNYEAEVYKRIYHNLPFLMKTKGTERGLRALINCFGIPNFLEIKQYGGTEIGSSQFVGYESEVTSSLNKIRTESRASGSAGKVLTVSTSIQKKETDRIKDIHRVEIGFSPTDQINKYILSQIPSSFNIDDHIGDPRDLNSSSYISLDKEATRALLSSDRTQLNDFIRILKFFDNTLFKMVRDFLPLRASVDTGIIIKPHILNRSKAKSPTITGTQPEYSASIDTAFTTGSHGGAYYINQKAPQSNIIGLPGIILTGSAEATTAHSISIPTISGSVVKDIGDESPQYNGELSGSFITVSTGELNDENVFKKQKPPRLRYQIIPTALDVETLTQFQMYTYLGGGTGSAELACQINGNIGTFYHNGTGTYPQAGDIIYEDSIGTNTLDGNDEWWNVVGAAQAILISGSVTPQYEGTVGYVQDCSAFDSTPPSGYTATWSNVPRWINTNNYTAVSAIIYGGEIGATYFASASDFFGALSSNTATGIITSATQSIVLNTGDLADGQTTLNVRLADSSGNTGSLATVANVGFLPTLTQTKDTVVPSGYTVRFTTSNYSTNETINYTGNFYLKVESIPTSESGTIYYSLQSTGGGTYSGQTSFSNGTSSKNIAVYNLQHNLQTGTVTATVYIVDTAGNQGSNTTDTNSLQVQSGTLSPSTVTNVDGDGDTFTLSVDVTPNTLNWTLDKPSWISISGASGTGDDASINVLVDANPDTSNSRSGTITLKTGTTNLDFTLVTQEPGTNMGGYY